MRGVQGSWLMLEVKGLLAVVRSRLRQSPHHPSHHSELGNLGFRGLAQLLLDQGIHSADLWSATTKQVVLKQSQLISSFITSAILSSRLSSRQLARQPGTHSSNQLFIQSAQSVLKYALHITSSRLDPPLIHKLTTLTWAYN